MIRDAESWNKLINSFKHDFYHTWDFHHLSQTNYEGVPVLFSLESNEGAVVFPLLEREIDQEENRDLISVYGYSGPLFSVKDKEAQNILVEKLFQEIAKLGYISLFSRLHPAINDEPLDHVTNLSDIVYFDLNDSVEDIYAAMRKVHRRDIRKLKSSEFTLKRYCQVSSEQISEFKRIYDLTMDKLNAAEYYYFDQQYFEMLFASDDYQASLYTVYFEEKAVASAIMVQTGNFGQYHLSGTLPEFYRDYPMKLIIGHALEDMHNEGIKYFILGGGVGSSRDSLFDFKYGFARRTKPFSIMKKIFNPVIYQKLSDKRFEALSMSIESIKQVNYFPLYRYSK